MDLLQFVGPLAAIIFGAYFLRRLIEGGRKCGECRRRVARKAVRCGHCGQPLTA